MQQTQPHTVMIEMSIANYSVANWQHLLNHIKAQWPNDYEVELQTSYNNINSMVLSMPKDKVTDTDLDWFHKMQRRNIIVGFRVIQP